MKNQSPVHHCSSVVRETLFGGGEGGNNLVYCVEVGMQNLILNKVFCAFNFRRFRKKLEKRLLASSCLSVRLSIRNEQVGCHMTDFMKFHVRVFFENLSIKFKFNYNLTTITGTLHADRYIFVIISRSVLLRMRNVSDKSCTESQITYFVFCNISSPKSCCL